MMITPLMVAAFPTSLDVEEEPQGWWSETTVDRNDNKIGDMVELHIDNPIFLDDENT